MKPNYGEHNKMATLGKKSTSMVTGKIWLVAQRKENNFIFLPCVNSASLQTEE